MGKRAFSNAGSLRAESPGAVARRVALSFAAAAAFGALTAASARLQLRLPFTPVPVTGQVFCVLLAGCALGPRLGFLSQLGYLAAGAVGLPVFALGGGIHYLLGPTGGYLAAFPLAALAAGAMSQARPGRGMALLACLAGVVTIYVFGAAWYGVWSAVTGQSAGMVGVLYQSVVPFIGPDALKAILASGVAPALQRRLSAL